MKKNDILDDIYKNVGIKSFGGWTKRQIIEWVELKYRCSKYIAKMVAEHLIVVSRY